MENLASGKKELDTRKRWQSQSWINAVLIFNINERVIKGLYMSHANFYIDEKGNEMVSKSLKILLFTQKRKKNVSYFIFCVSLHILHTY